MSLIKSLLPRLKPTPAEPAAAPVGGDSAFSSSTQFGERADEAEVFTTWAERAPAIGAQLCDPVLGAELFRGLWEADRHGASLNAEQRKGMLHYLQFFKVPAGQDVICQDEQGDYMLMVLEGTIAVDRIQPKGGRTRLAEAQAGDMLGEMSLLDAGARFSTCTTLTPCTLAVVDAQRLGEMIDLEPRVGMALLASLARRLSLRLRLVSARLNALLAREEA
ncbi:MAG: cyclic nucleotide-binding domain-containing protein [Burkholderiaceae bacterium]|nr:cyclic nucleotide-binding domain-containing protein [Burkholderiaceae bacterium]MDH3459422.1 cyclic nucleotide-binding domain-containing protein [Burkholderiaceae bacterium]